jgi:hypothetical protein
MKEFRFKLYGHSKMEILDEDGFPYLTALRPRDLSLIWNTKIFTGNHLLLKCTYSIFIFIRFKLKFQDLPKQVSLVKYERRRGMKVDGDIYSIHRNYFKKPLCQFFKNDQPCGEVLSSGQIISFSPYEYRIVFEEASDDNLYLLISLMTYFTT